MKDLYRRFGYGSPADNTSKLEAAIDARDDDPSTQKRARHILLDPRRKAIYDRNYGVVKTIGQLRANLGLSRSPSWLQTSCRDFDREPSGSASELEQLRKYARTADASPFRGWVWVFLGAGLIFAAVWIGYRYENREVDETTPSRTTPSVARRLSYEDFRSALDNRGWAPSDARNLASVAYSVHQNRRLELREALSETLRGRVLARPFHGAVERFHASKAIAPFEIVTRRSSGDYFVKLVDWYSKKTVLTVFVHHGSRAELDVPTGSYELRYAVCPKWYGPTQFGPYAVFSRADERLDFKTVGQQVTGYTVELFLQSGGNFVTEEIPPGAF